jgi:hypothetical protein
MSTRRLTLLAMGVAAIGFAAFMSKLTVSAQERAQLGTLSVSEGIYVDTKNFGIIKGTAKVDPAAQIAKLGATEVKDGAIIVRVGDKLYLVDADPKAKSLYTGWAAEAFSGNMP